MIPELTWIAAAVCLLTGTAAVLRQPRGWTSWCFFLGMLLLGIERFAYHAAYRAAGSATAGERLSHALLVSSALVAVWLCFSLVYARGNRMEFLRRWKWILLASLVIPPGILIVFQNGILERIVTDGREALRFLAPGKAWVIAVLLVTLGILANLEKTFRASVGMSRWRIKYLFLGVAMIFGVKLYSFSQILLFSAYNPDLAVLGNVGVLLGCGLIAVAHFRSSFGKLDLYPSRAVLQGSLTVILAGGYFLIVGVLAQVVSLLGGTASLPAQTFIILVGLVGLTVLLLSERFRTGLQRFVSRHFRRAEHDFRKIWTDFTRRTSSVLDAETLGKNAGEVIAENFHVLAVTVFAVNADSTELEVIGATEKPPENPQRLFEPDELADLGAAGRPYDLEKRRGRAAEMLREICPRKFGHGGDRWVVPLVAAERLMGLVVLVDRVNGVPYSHEELDLLGCIGDQLAAGLLNGTLTEKVVQARELAAFQTLSTFFVHDLKNAANSLNLTLQNLPVHFDDPEFREDAIRAVGRTVDRINKMILNLSSLRREIELQVAPCQPADLITEVLDEMEHELEVGQRIVRGVDTLPEIPLDREAIRSVLTNLITNASEAIEGAGRIAVGASADDGSIRITVEDNGSGMSEDYVRTQLFRPFHSTKTKGLGIGMFQCKTILEAHGGGIRVDSEPGRGTRFILRLPGTPPLPQSL
jgi:putative PEP-CTERM system histidine kinase